MEDKIGERWIGMLVFPCGCFTAFGSFMWFFLYIYIGFTWQLARGSSGLWMGQQLHMHEQKATPTRRQ